MQARSSAAVQETQSLLPLCILQLCYLVETVSLQIRHSHCLAEMLCQTQKLQD